MRRLTILLALAAVAMVASVAVADAKLDPKEVLSVKNGRFYLEGKPFAEISFNKFDLFWQLYGILHEGKGDTQQYKDMIAAQDQALRELHEMGFKTIRFFALPWGIWDFRDTYPDPVKREKIFYKAMDTALDLCDKNNIKVVYSLGAGNFTDASWKDGKIVQGKEQLRDLIGNPNSENRKFLYQYIDDVVTRYKNRKTIAMWEISNEVTLTADVMPDHDNIVDGQRMPSLKDVSEYFDSVTKRIKKNDSLRLVNSGGSSLRPSQWTQYTKHKWGTDTVDEQFKAFKMLYGNTAIDIIDIHYYPGPKWGDMVIGEDGKETAMSLRRYMNMAKMLNKPLYVGECGTSPLAKDDPNNKQIFEETPDYLDSYQDPIAQKWVQRMLDEIVDSGVQLSHWWEYSSNRDVDQVRTSFDLKKGKTDPVLRQIIDANKRLKAKLRIPSSDS
ncbi:MAG: cellulase family glycosylhydrolase [Armatimonadota bacterium]|nr:cellulase family glycosylhydrolase [bacterium]